MRIGIIGTGNIGGMLAAAFAVNPHHDVYVFNRTPGKAIALAETTRNIHLARSTRDVAQVSDVLFVATKARDGQHIFAEIGPLLARTQLLVATISSVNLAELEGLTVAGVAKVIPSIVQTQRMGSLLVAYGPSLSMRLQSRLKQLLAEISTPFAVSEDQIRVASDLSSCSPAFIAYLIVQWAQVAAETRQVSYAEAEHLLVTTLTGTAQLLESGLTLQDIITKVAVPGGVTEVGLQALAEPSRRTFADLHEATERYARKPLVVNPSGV